MSANGPGRPSRATAGGVRLHHVDEGRGQAVALLHGFTGSSVGMQEVAAGLRPHWRVLRLDLVGHGRSEAPEDPACYSMLRCTEQVANALARLRAERPHLLGYSMGGRVALSLAAARPHAFRSLVLVGASAGIADPIDRAARRAADEALAARIERDGVPAFAEAWARQPLFASQARRLSHAARARQREERLANSARGLANSLRGMGTGAQPPLHAALQRVEVPALLAVGAEDAKFRGIADELAAALPDARVAVIPEAGHAAHLENPRAFLEATHDFFREVEAREAARSAPPAPHASANRQEMR